MIWFRLANHGNAIAALELNDGTLDGFKKIPFVAVIDEVCQNFRIGLTRKFKAFSKQSTTNRLKVFNDAVMYDADEIAGKGCV